MPHEHSHAALGRAFGLGIALNLAFVGIETFYGLRAHSLALLSDAGHNLSDVLSLALAWVASVLARRTPTARHTYGLRRSSILVALFNALLLLLAVGGIAWEALRRLGSPVTVAGGTMMLVAAIGIAVNAGTALLFVRSQHADLNVRGAFLHMVADAAVSLGVVIAALCLRLTGWLWLDPAISLVIAAVITLGTWRLLRESLNLALDAVPETIDREAVERHLAAQPGVASVHDLHIWAMSTTETALTVHMVLPDGIADDGFYARLSRDLHERFGIDHSTIQVERGSPSQSCELAPADVV